MTYARTWLPGIIRSRLDPPAGLRGRRERPGPFGGYRGLASEQTSPHMSLHFRADRPWPHVALVVLAFACIFSLAASTARAAEQWNDGVPATSTQVKCVINLQETGAIAKAGYLADPSKPPTAGQVFYGRADFGATTDTACSSGDQVAELDVVLPPGVSLAVDSAHPITCLYADDGGTETNYPTCPTQAIVGAYGPAIPSDDAGHAWTMPAGREFDIRFPLRSDRKLTGPAGGHCPQSVDEIPAYPQRDCLLIALHVADGYSDPWLTPSEELFIDPAASRAGDPADAGRLAHRFPERASREGGEKGIAALDALCDGLPRKRQGRRSPRRPPSACISQPERSR